MATAKRLPSGSYRVRVYNSFKKQYKSFTAASKREAEIMGAAWLADCERQEDLVRHPTFKRGAELYITEKSSVLSPTTIQGYKVMLKNNTARLNEIKLSDITPRLVQDWINELTVAKSPKTVHNVYGFFTAVMNYHDVDIKLSRITLPKKTRHFKRLPTAKVVLDAFKGSEIEVPVLLAVWCGMRISEILGVRRSDIDGNILTINRVGVYVDGKLIYKDAAKTYESNRQLELAQPLMELINSLPCTADEPVVPFSRRQVYSRFVKIMKEQGYSITFHDLRHVNASVMAALGVPDLYAMERGGWSNTTTLKQVYQQTFNDERKRIDTMIDSYFSKLYDTEYDTKNIKCRKYAV